MTGCERAAVGYGRLCESHKTRKRRHGDPLQKTISWAALQPFQQEAERWIATNPENNTWSIAEQRWAIFVGGVDEIYRTTMHTPTRKAAEEAMKLGRHVAPRQILLAILAMYLMKAEESWRFRSENGFRYQLVRIVRGLSRPAKTVSTTRADGRPKQSLRDLQPMVIEVLAALLVEVLGGLGVHLAQKRARDRLASSTEKEDLAKAIRDLK